MKVCQVEFKKMGSQLWQIGKKENKTLELEKQKIIFLQLLLVESPFSDVFADNTILSTDDKLITCRMESLRYC